MAEVRSQEILLQNTGYIDKRIILDRRNFTMMTAIKSITNPRRKSHHRQDEEPFAQKDWYHPKVSFLAIGIVLLSIIDSFFTLKLLSAGALETNTVMAYFINIGVSTFILSKLAMTIGGVLILTVLSSHLFMKRFRAVEALTGCFIVYLALMVYELKLLSL